MKQRILSLSVACGLALLAGASAAQGFKASNDKARAGMRVPAAAAATAAAAPAAPRSADFIVAVVNSEPVTNVEVQQQVERLRAQAEASNMPADTLRRQALEMLIGQKIQLQMAAERNLQVDSFAVQQAEESVARQNSMTMTELRARLVREGISETQFRADLKKQLVIQKLREAEVDSKVRVSDLDIDQYLREQKAKAGMANAVTQLNLGHILVTVPENASEAQVKQLQAKAQQAADKIRAGEDFQAAVAEFSDVPDGKGGGPMGLRPADRYPELFVKATQSTAVGSIAGPVRSPAGFHILKVLEKSSGEVPAIVTQSHARHILLRPSAQLSEAQAVERLEDYRRRVLAQQDTFDDLARRYSEDGSAKEGGDLGWASPRKFVPEFEEALNALQPGEISPPIASRFGIHLIQLLERREAKLNQREQRDMVRSIVRENKLEQAFSTWAQEARARAYVEYREPPQ
ncbi:peptidyl-prolyl cis-trans isomerase SurA [Comamonas sp. BIGb0152]|uniref:peptidylprolyl isomerase n=1 Tax=Comamonas sp. BIGb0152 TaxID=2940601 RepID=UPI00216A70DA|nr:peptidylprolyl isomerase [Comamonas sp. BIGb0152]MCS4293997.1 peptidyl-prolyl cis-trans isomerase SurA [Comamonas sp. BIGb0152]